MAKTRFPLRAAAPVVTVRAAPGRRSRALVSFGNWTVPAAIGRSGRSPFKREGDGATPIAAMKVLYGFFRGDRILLPPTSLPMRRIGKAMLWCDQPEDANYNRLVKAPFAASHEVMARDDGLYDVCIVLDWNIRSRQRHRGSAIFFHLIRPGYEPTAGCVAVGRRDMALLLRHLRPGAIVRVL